MYLSPRKGLVSWTIFINLINIHLVFCVEKKISQEITSVSEDDYIVLFKDPSSDQLFVSERTTSSRNVVKARVDDLGSKYNLEKKNIYSDVLYGFSASNFTTDDLKNIRKEKGVSSVEKDGIISIDVIEEKSHGNIRRNYVDCPRKKGRIPWNIRRVGWKDVEHNDTFMNKRVFVIDTGVAYLPKALNIDTNLARNFISQDVGDWDDCNGHGTHVSGTIAAKRNGVCGIVGVAAGITIVPIRIMDCFGKGKVSNTIAAINYVAKVANAGDVVNLSFGGRIVREYRILDIAVENASKKGILFAISSGNDNEHSSNYTPARANGHGIYTVCALNRKRITGFSNYGNPPVDVCAPGTNIISLSTNGGRLKKTGTSMAAPHISGLLVFGPLMSNHTISHEKIGIPYTYSIPQL